MHEITIWWWWWWVCVCVCLLHVGMVEQLTYLFLGTFSKLRKTTISFVVSVSPTIRMEQLGSHWTDCHEI
jgi:hypothetical protein